MNKIRELKKGEDFVGVTVVYFCHDGQGNFVMALRSKNARDEQYKWDIGGGGLELHDTIEDTLKKEIKEEYAADVIDYEFLGYRDVHRMHKNKKTHWVTIDFKVLINKDQLKNNEPHKFDDVAWFTLDKLPQNLHSQVPNFFEIYEKRLKNDHSTLELVDIVDKNCQVLYSTSKKEAHEKGLLHKTVIGGVVDSSGNITLVKQSAHRQDAGQFVSPVGGHVTAGESDRDAIQREAEEEIGLTNIKYKFIGKKIYNRHILGRQENHYFIVYEIMTDEPLRLNDEAVEYKKFSLQELRQLYKKTPHIFGDAFIFELKSFYPDLIK